MSFLINFLCMATINITLVSNNVGVDTPDFWLCNFVAIVLAISNYIDGSTR